MCKKMKLFLLMLLTIVFFTPGCSKITKENYDKLEIGMEYSEVITLLGKPDNCADTMGAKSCIWGNEAKNIRISFLAEKSVIFSSVGIK